MAQRLDFNQPFLDLRKFVPVALRNPVNMGLLDNLFNRFLTHNESVPLFGYIGRRPADSEDTTPRIPQSTPERDINAVIPVLNFEMGAQKYAFTTQDLLNKAKVLGIDTDNQAWLYSQGNNFRPPISFDKFTNFFNYYWVAKALPATPSLAWNTELKPEYIVIATPQPADLDKLNVVAASGASENYVLTGTGFLDQTFTLTFTAPDTFTITLSAALLGPLGIYTPVQSTFTLDPLPSVPQVPAVDVTQTITFQVTGPAGTFTLLNFVVTRGPTFDGSNIHNGYDGFNTGDVFDIETQYLSPNFNITFSGSPSTRGTISGVTVLSAYQEVDGFQLSKGDRVLIKDQLTGTENGIYVVSEGVWARSNDYDTDTWAVGARTFVRGGVTNTDTLWESGPTIYDWAVVPGVNVSNTNDWQEGNFWVHVNDLADLGLERSAAFQAVRPIIEFETGLQLNAFVDVDGNPSDAGFEFRQVKTTFGQLPFFDLYRYDGTHSGLVSSIFYYEEDLTADLDPVLQRRVKKSTNDSADFLFNHGCADNDGDLLFFKQSGALKTVWHAGYMGPTVVDYAASPDNIGDGTLSGVSAGDITQQQVWTLVATSATTFEIGATKMPTIPAPYDVVTVGVPYDNGDIALTINAGGIPFEVNDQFTIRIGNLERPRYVYRAADDSIQDLFGGPAADVDDIGAYMVSRTYVHNPYNDSRAEMTEGSLYTHFRSVLANKHAYLPLDYAFGGNIKLWSEQHTLLASLLMQRDLTIISMIDMAQRQYETGLNAIQDLFRQKVLDYFSLYQVVDSDGSPAQTARANELLDYLLSFRANDNDVRTVLFDTTAGVVGFPATLPQLGLGELVTPQQLYDLVLSVDALQHHDGHLSALFVDSLSFRDDILSPNRLVPRSDGTSTPAVGSFTLTPPVNPYRGELWLRPTGGDVSEMLAYDVLYDTISAPPLGPVGSYWYNRAGTLYMSDGANWVAQPDPLVAWVDVNLATLLNELMLITEQRLYNAINPDQRRYDFAPLLTEPEFQNELQRELFNFAALQGLDPLGTNYTPLDAFTWNYSDALLANFPPLSTPTVPARWYDIIASHTNALPGVFTTQRPDLEPWCLFGFTDYATWWASLPPIVQAAYTPFATPSELNDGTFINGGSVRAVKTALSVTALTGLPVVDGVALNPGDILLLQNEVAPINNGPWVVAAGAWSRLLLPLTYKTVLTVTEGQTRANTVWALTATATPGVDPVLFSQVRRWTDQMWADVTSYAPLLRTSVDPFTDVLLPPYVSPTSPVAGYALTTVIPANISDPFQFGEGSPVEEVWERSIDYGYALAKALARFDPLALLGFAWGFNWVEVDGILYDGYDINMPGHKRFRLHGESVTSEHTAADLTLTGASGPVDLDLVLTYDGYDTLRRQSFSVRLADGTLLGTFAEGQTSTFTGGGYTLSTLRIEDRGQPFHVGDRFNITALASGADLEVTFTPSSVYLYLGLGQTFTDALREVAVSTTNSYAMSAYRGWDVNMGYRAGGLVSTDDLNIFTDMETLSPAAYTLLFKRNEIAKDMWLQALRVTVLQPGTFAEQYVGAGVFRGPLETTPAGDASDWVFRIEGYNPRYTPITYHVLAPIASGMSFPTIAPIGQRFFRHDLGDYFEFDGVDWNVINSTDLVTFNALDQTATTLTFFRSTQVVSTATGFLPLTITGLQNLVTFLYGYASYVEEEGWRFASDNEFNVDAETGRHRNFQLEVEKTVDRVYRGIQVGQGHVVNPFMDRVWVYQETGLLAPFRDSALFDITGDAGVFDVLGVRFSSSDVVPIRGNLLSSFSTRAPMYSAHAQIDEYEHLFIFNNWAEASIQSGMLYDPFSGSRTVTYKFNGKMQGSSTMRPEFGGYYVVGNEVKQNLQASTDSIANAYDPNLAFENEKTSKHAFALLGFNLKDYFSNLDVSDKTQFNFWRGMVHAKGTNMSIEAYLNANRYRDAQIDEYWAYKLATYGDARQHDYPEMRLNVVDNLQQFTQLQFDALPAQALPNFIQISSVDESRWFSIDDLDQNVYFKAEVAGTYTKDVDAGDIVQLPFVSDLLFIAGPAVQVNSTTLLATGTGNVSVVGYGPATGRYTPAKLINYVADEVVEDISHWHPAAGYHTPTAMADINIIGDVNPAHYNYSTLVENNNNYDPLRPWAERELGRTWFDTRNLAYVPYYDPTVFPNRAERLSRWGALADFATVDVYEWVQSTVPPDQYAALAAQQSLDADITDAERASGQPALEETYVRDRLWSIRPIAWSQTGTVFGGHPSFNGSFDSKLYVKPGIYWLEFGTFEGRGISAGMRIGAWDPNPAAPKAVTEALVTTEFVKVFSDGTSNVAAALTSLTLPSSAGVPANVTVTMSEHTQQTGQLVFTAEPISGIPRLDPDSVVIGFDFTIAVRCMDFDSGEQQVVVLDTVFNTVNVVPDVTLTAGSAFTYTFDAFGLQVTAVVTTAGTYGADELATAIVSALDDNVVSYDAVFMEVVAGDATEQPGVILWSALSNDPDDQENIANNGIGWTAWNVPTQAQLNSDGRQPNAIWKPYPGDYYSFFPSETQLNEAIAYNAAPLTLNNGTIIERYVTSWTGWEKLVDSVYTSVATITGPVSFTHFENIDPARTTVYVNGIAQLVASYTIVGDVITVTSVTAGSPVRVIVRKYSPSAEELAFDPETADNLTFQQQYKNDFEYVAIPQRDSEGSFSSVLYYFWVKNRTVVANSAGKDLSVQAIVQQLQTGPAQYLTFQAHNDLIGTGTTSDPYRYDAITIAGLAYQVTQDDTFKLRFTRNFILRDDPEELNRKNVHTEWGLIRPAQKVRVPERLWNKLVDSMAGQDAAGNEVPALRRVLYDQRNGSATRFGFNSEQTLAPSSLLTASVTYTILNTQLVDTSGPVPVPDFITFLDFNDSASWFQDAASTRSTMTDIWTNAKVSQINEIFFAALEDVLASNYELTDIFKTSRLSAYSIKVVSPNISVPVYE